MSEIENSQQFIHDCPQCEFLGHFMGHDIYRCPQGGFPTLVARYGNEGPDYTSGISVHLSHEVAINLLVPAMTEDLVA